MNKKFSTLLVSALLASGAAFAQANSYEPKEGDKPGDFDTSLNAYIKAGTDYLGVDALGNLTVYTSVSDGVDLSRSLWSIQSKKTTTAAGPTYTYSLVNNATGQALSVKLNTTHGTTGPREITKFEKGNSEWAWDKTKGLYAMSGDSIFSLSVNAGNKLELNSVPVSSTGAAPSGTVLKHGEIPTDVTDPDASISLDAAGFNALVKSGNLYFNGKDVSEGQANAITANVWTAEQAYTNGAGSFVESTVLGAQSHLFLSSAKKVDGKKQYLLVDQEVWDESSKALHKLAVDTLSFDLVDDSHWDNAVTGIDPTDATAIATAKGKADAAVDASAIAKATINGKYHPMVAEFEAEYYIANDSIVLKAVNAPEKIQVYETITKLAGNVNTTTNKFFKDTELTDLIAAVNNFVSTPTTDTKFADVTFSGKTGKELIDAAKKANKEVEEPAGEVDKATYKAEKDLVDAFMAGIEGLAYSDDTTPVLSSTKYPNAAFKDGVNGMKYAAISTSDNWVVLRTLAGTTILTLGSSSADKANTAPLIQPYKEKQTIGGDAEIAEGLYYIKDHYCPVKVDYSVFEIIEI